SRGRRYVARGKLGLEGCAAGFRKRAVVVLGTEPAIGDHHLMRMNAPLRGDCSCTGERRRIDEAADEKAIFLLRQSSWTRAKTRKPTLESGPLRHKQHGNAPETFPQPVFVESRTGAILIVPILRCTRVLQCRV